MKLEHPWRWAIGSLVVVVLSAAAFLGYDIGESLRSDYGTAGVIRIVDDYVRTHGGNWPSSWGDLDATEAARRSQSSSSYWRKYTRVDFTLTSEQLIENPDLIYDAVTPLSGEYFVYPNAREDLDRVMQAIRDARKSPTAPAR
jgi:hypothetical protein